MKRDHETAQRFIEETLKLIAEKEGSIGVNLREISKRVGVAHTSAYNYFTDFQDLKYAALEEAIKVYSGFVIRDLNNEMNPYEYYAGMIKNFVHFVIENPGLYRFISTDPINVKELPDHIMKMIISMKGYLIDVITVLSMDQITIEESENLTNIILAYVDGEAIALVTERIVPGEDIYTRIHTNALKIFTLFTSTTSNGINLREIKREEIGDYPELNI